MSQQSSGSAVRSSSEMRGVLATGRAWQYRALLPWCVELQKPKKKFK